jgi:predicted ATPase/class 3 adenylate cyclase
MPDLPTGTVTFLFTDIEASTRMLARLGDDFAGVLEIHNAILRRAIVDSRGIELATQGDSFFAVFTSADDAVRAAIDGQRWLASHAWPPGGAVRVRMGMHTGEAMLGGDNYVGLSVHRASRIADAAHGGQVVLSAATAPLVRQNLPNDVSLVDLGEHWLKDLDRPESLVQLVIDGLPAEFPPLRGAAGRPVNLPDELTTFIGREAELAEIERMLDRSRLVTLVGPGGTGKTRLSIRAAERLAPRFADGVAFVPLATVGDPAQLPAAIADALALRQDPAQPVDEVVRDHLRSLELLLVLDNLEQLPGADEPIGRLLRDAAGLRVLATSRAPLHVAGEQQFPVPPLGLPDHGEPQTLGEMRATEAVTLFLVRARSVGPTFELTDDNAKDVVAICARLDGLPLAIELAAARIGLLTPAAMLARLERPLALLSTQARGVTERQRTLRGAIAWSHDLLTPAESRLFRRLSVFAGGWTLEAAEAIAGEGTDVLDLLASLVDNSLVRRTDRAGEPHFAMLETIREFAAEQLASHPEESNDARLRHATYWTEVAERVAPTLELESDAALRLAADQDNLRSALRFTLGGGPGAPQPGEEAADRELGLRLGIGLGPFWLLSGAREGSAWLERAIHVARTESAQLQAKVYFWSGVLLDIQFREEEAERCLLESLARVRQFSDPPFEARLLNSLGVVARSRGELERAHDLLDESLALRAEMEGAPGVATVLNNLAVVAVDEGDLDAARGHLERALELERKGGNLEGIATCLGNLASVALRGGDVQRARPLIAESLHNFARIGDRLGIAEDLEHAADAASQLGQPARAARLFGAAETMRASEGLRMTDVDAAHYRELVDRVRGVLGQAAYAEAFTVGCAMSRDAAIAAALADLEAG